MKTIISFFVFLFSSFLFSQEYIPMLEQGNVWNIINYDALGNTYFNYTRSITGTTIINGKTYSIISNVQCPLREEGGKVYGLPEGGNEEIVLMDFTLQTDDIFIYPVDYGPCFANWTMLNPNLTVINRTVEFIAGMDRIVIELDNGESWVEGVGSTAALFPGGLSAWDIDSRLSCFTFNGDTYFFNGYTSCAILSVDSFFKNQITLYPNPVTQTSVLKFPEEANIDAVKIYDVSGRLISKESINENYYTIEAVKYGSGLYFYQVFSEGSLLKSDTFIIK
ncbi:MAG: T9SS type A sorting domain-containing protein [Flavobacteriaceae bacterium]|nr:T9SS type A sorting domain-containing protein [Flavobacteriaceae bacterium]